jgi:hypothetical protein
MARAPRETTADALKRHLGRLASERGRIASAERDREVGRVVDVTEKLTGAITDYNARFDRVVSELKALVKRERKGFGAESNRIYGLADRLDNIEYAGYAPGASVTSSARDAVSDALGSADVFDELSETLGQTSDPDDRIWASYLGELVNHLGAQTAADWIDEYLAEDDEGADGEPDEPDNGHEAAE